MGSSDFINILGVFYVAMPLLVMLIGIFMWLFGKGMKKEYFDKVIEVSKWYLVSVALVMTAKIIEAGFTERETGIKEMQVYDNYVETILQADNIEARWRLAEYYSTVTPTERLRTKWTDYKNAISEDYFEFKKLKLAESKLEIKDSLSIEEKTTLVEIRKNLAPLENSLAPSSIGRWAVVFTGNKSSAEANEEKSRLLAAGIEEVNIYYRDQRYRTLSSVFEKKDEALRYLELLKGIIRKDSYIINLNNWCQEFDLKSDIIHCK